MYVYLYKLQIHLYMINDLLPTSEAVIKSKSISAPIKANSNGCAICQINRNPRDTRFCKINQ